MSLRRNEYEGVFLRRGRYQKESWEGVRSVRGRYQWDSDYWEVVSLGEIQRLGSV